MPTKPKRKGPTPPRKWGAFHQATRAHNTKTKEEHPIADLGDELWVNNLYTVVLTRYKGGGTGLIHLSIRRNDRRIMRDWRDLQRIKNELVGPLCEGVEVFPSEDRLVDTANQYHLWVCPDPNYRLPFGFDARLVLDAGEGDDLAPGAVQRPFTREKSCTEENA